MNKLLAPILPQQLYWIVVVALVVLLMVKEIIGPLRGERDQRWRLALNAAILLLLIRFIVHMVFKVIQVISWFT
jgi:hypothetical protein